jgi:hypothetical protein
MINGKNNGADKITAMAKKNPKIKIRGPENGYCNICERYGKLTDDHVPPKGSAKIGVVEIRTLSEHFSTENSLFHISQKGLLIRSICATCNNKRLGEYYDPHLNKISHEVRKLVKAYGERRLIWPNKINITITPQRVVRAIVGHLLAGSLSDDKLNTPIKAPMPDGLRTYFLNESAPIPEELEIYYWLYLSNEQKILKTLAVAIPGNKQIIVGEFLKFFPLSYWLVWDKPASIEINLYRLTRRKSIALDDTDDIEIDFQNNPHPNWPENPDDNMLILYREDGTKIASRKVKRY